MPQQALSSGLAGLLQDGPLQGKVLSNLPSGKMTIALQSRTFALDAPGSNFRAGDAVTVRIVEGRLELELMGRAARLDSPSSSEAPARSLGASLANMGLSGSNVQILAQALLQAGIPLDPAALRELAQVFPQLHSEQMTSLSFLFSRGLPFNPAIVSILAQLFMPRPRISETINRVIDRLNEIGRKLDGDEDSGADPVLDASQRRKLRDAQEALERSIFHLREQCDPQQEREFDEILAAALASPEALIQQHPSGAEISLGESVVHLFVLLMDLWPDIEPGAHAQLFAILMQDVQQLHETLAGQAIQNLPPQSGAEFHPIFVQIPINVDGQNHQLEIRYKPKGKKRKSGQLDFRIELSRLGAIHTAIQWDHPRISVTLTTADSSVQKFIQTALDELKDLLQNKGFQVQSIGAIVGEVPPQLNRREKEKMSTPESLDLRA